MDDLRAGTAEDVDVSPRPRVLLHLLRPELEEELHAGGDPAARLERLGEHLRVGVHVVHLPRGAGAAVGDVDRDVGEVGDEGAVRGVARDPAVGIAGRRHHGDDRREVDRVDAAAVLRAGVGPHEAAAERLLRHARPARRQPLDSLLVALADPGLRAALGGHVGERRALVHGQGREPRAAELHDAVERLLLAGEGREDVEHHVLRHHALAEPPL